MNPKIKQAWIEALISGKYRQGKSQLFSSKDRSYCCLGVLCKLAEQDGIGYFNIDYFLSNDSHDHNEVVLPISVQKWSGLNEANPVVKFNNGLASLASLNDGGKSFVEIANLIEQSL